MIARFTDTSSLSNKEHWVGLTHDIPPLLKDETGREGVAPGILLATKM